MNFEHLTEENILYYALKNYDNPTVASLDEFYNDFRILKYIKRLLNRHERTGVLSERLILNHLIILYNVFGSASTRMLFFKMEDKYYPILKSFLEYLGRCPVVIRGVPNNIDLLNVVPNSHVSATLRNL